MPSRSAWTWAMYHQARTCSSALTASRKLSSLRLPRVGARTLASAIASRGGLRAGPPGPGWEPRSSCSSRSGLIGPRRPAPRAPRAPGRGPRACRRARSAAARGPARRAARRRSGPPAAGAPAAASRSSSAASSALGAAQRRSSSSPIRVRRSRLIAAEPAQRGGSAPDCERQIAGGRLHPGEAAGDRVARGRELIEGCGGSESSARSVRRREPTGRDAHQLDAVGAAAGDLGRAAADVDHRDAAVQLALLAGECAGEGEPGLLGLGEDPQAAGANPARRPGPGRRASGEPRSEAVPTACTTSAPASRAVAASRSTSRGRAARSPAPAGVAKWRCWSSGWTPPPHLGDQEPGRVRADVDHADDQGGGILSDSAFFRARPFRAEFLSPGAPIPCSGGLPAMRLCSKTGLTVPECTCAPLHPAPARAVRARARPRSAAPAMTRSRCARCAGRVLLPPVLSAPAAGARGDGSSAGTGRSPSHSTDSPRTLITSRFGRRPSNSQ